MLHKFVVQCRNTGVPGLLWWLPLHSVARLSWFGVSFQLSVRKFQSSKLLKRLSCFALLHSLQQPQWKSIPPLGTFVGGAALESCVNFRVMLPLHQRKEKKTALRVIYRFIMTFWIYLCISVSFSFYSLILQKHTIVSVNIFFCICAFASFDLLLTMSVTAFPFFLDYGGFANCQKLNISFDLISSCPICSIQPSLLLCVEFNILICLWMQNDMSRKCQSHIFWKMGPILSLWLSTLTASRGPGECLPVDKNALASQHNTPQPCTLQSPTNSS